MDGWMDATLLWTLDSRVTNPYRYRHPDQSKWGYTALIDWLTLTLEDILRTYIHTTLHTVTYVRMYVYALYLQQST